MSFWRAMAARGGGYDDQTMSLPSFSKRADGEELVLSLSKEPRKHMQCAFESAKEDPTAGARSLSVRRRIGMTAALPAR
jgi:hypothetical protein